MSFHAALFLCESREELEQAFLDFKEQIEKEPESEKEKLRELYKQHLHALYERKGK